MNEDALNDNQRKQGRCIIKGCINYYGKWTTKPVSYYAVPTANFKHWKTDRRLTWMQAIIKHNRLSSDWQATKNLKLCNLHFVGGKKSEHPLHPSYNPTLFPSQKIVEAERVQNIKQQIVEDWSEEPLSARISTVEHEPKRQRRKKPKVKDTRPTQPTIVLVRTNFVEETMKCEENGASSNDFECQVEFDECESGCENPVNCLICNLRVENEMKCAETQVYMKKHENPWNNNSIEFAWEQKIQFAGISSVRFNDNLIDLCGVNFKQFNVVLRRLLDNPENSSVSNANRLFITLIKLRQGLSYVALSIYFTMQQYLVQKTFIQTLSFLKEFAENRIAWIKKEAIQNYLPEVFEPEYFNCRAIIDCIEIQVELPQSAEAQKEYYKNYKDCNTFKVFIACAPNGYVMYRSKCYGGQKADGLIAQDCGFLDLIKSDDVILTNQEFPSLDVALVNKGAILKKIDVTADSELFPLYIKMRESLNQLKHFKILSAIPIDQLENIDSIIQICCSLVNLHYLISVPIKENNML